MSAVRGLAVKRGIESFAVVVDDVSAQRLAGLADGVIGMQIHLLVFDRLSEGFDEDVVAPAALAVHADPDAALLQWTAMSLP